MTSPQPTNGLTWHSAPCNNGGCVEVAKQGDRVWLRDSNEEGPVLSFTEDEWINFLRGAKKGMFDLDRLPG